MTLAKETLENISHNGNTSLIIALPTEAFGKTSFDHIYLDFSHSGHEPIGIYNVAHFDVYFMMQPNAERSVIPPYLPTTATKFDNLPPIGIIPVPHLRLPAGMPLMGVHWANPTSTELNVGKFTETLIMDSCDGKMTFIEPMVSLDLLLTKSNITKSVPTPAKFAKAGYFPMKYSVKQVGNDAVISLNESMLMQQLFKYSFYLKMPLMLNLRAFFYFPYFGNINKYVICNFYYIALQYFIFSLHNQHFLDTYFNPFIINSLRLWFVIQIFDKNQL